MEFYGDATEVTLKADQSPLTQADLASHRWLVEGLTDWQPEVPIVSEESEGVADLARLPDLCWLIDPLDGTKEFISRNGEFTVNVALIENGRPILGSFYAPAIETTYAAALGVGTYRLGPVRCSEWFPTLPGSDPCGSSPLNPRHSAVRVAVSRSHLDARTQGVIDAIRSWLGEVELIPMGSSLKMGLVADGQADLYLRPAPTSKWDTGAGDAVATFAGGLVMDLTTGEELRYDGPGILNPPFAVLSAGFARFASDIARLAAV
jgi:3'(2'), 5'-bisphosphate nucleotidase